MNKKIVNIAGVALLKFLTLLITIVNKKISIAIKAAKKITVKASENIFFLRLVLSPKSKSFKAYTNKFNIFYQPNVSKNIFAN